MSNAGSTNFGTDEMSQLSELLERLKANRWLLLVILAVFVFLGLAGQLNFWTAFVSIAVLFAVVLLTPQTNVEVGAPSTVDGDNTKYGEAFAFLDVIPDPVMLLDSSGNIAFANPSFRAAFGATEIGASALLRFRSPDIQSLIRAAMSGESPEPIEYVETRPIARWFSVSARAVKNHEMKKLCLVHFYDLSEIRQTERIRSDFIANASHELRTPLASLTGFIETLVGPAREDAEARDRFLKVMQEQAERMSRLIDDLLTLSRIETGKGRAKFSEVDVSELIEHVIDALRPMAQNANTEIRFSMDAKPESAIVEGNRDELIQLFENLTENAIKYGGTDGRVDLILFPTSRGDEIIVEIRDRGPGIAEEHIPRLVERFYRVDVDTSRGKQGTGLGLSIVRHIAERHGGRLNIKSKVGEGSTFTVTLPVFSGNKT